MSRTDKDTPGWVSAVWYPQHHPSCGRRRPCDLPQLSLRHGRSLPPARWARRITLGWFTRCEWVYDWPRTSRGGQGSPPRWYINYVWEGPQRRIVRDRARRAVAEYRATGAVDVELPTGQHRHRAGWLWS